MQYYRNVSKLYLGARGQLNHFDIEGLCTYEQVLNTEIFADITLQAMVI